MEQDKSPTDIIADAMALAPNKDKAKAVARDSMVYALDFLKSRYGLKGVITFEYRRTRKGTYEQVPILL